LELPFVNIITGQGNSATTQSVLIERPEGLDYHPDDTIEIEYKLENFSARSG